MRRYRPILFCACFTGLLFTCSLFIGLSFIVLPAASVAAAQATQPASASQAAQSAPATPSPATLPTAQGLSRNPYFEDSDNLNKMAIELKKQVDRSSKDQLSLIVVRRADEIEKFAHSLRQRMRNGGAQ